MRRLPQAACLGRHRQAPRLEERPEVADHRPAEAHHPLVNALVRLGPLARWQRAILGKDLLVSVPAERVLELHIHRKREERVALPFGKVRFSARRVFAEMLRDHRQAHAAVRRLRAADAVNHIHREEIAGHFGLAREGPIRALVVVAQFMEEAPVALGRELLEVDDLGFAPNDEVDERRWVPLRDADTVLSYERERSVLARLDWI